MINNFYNKIREIKNIYIIISFIFLIGISSILFLNTKSSHATAGDNMYGYAWSENTGWISFNNCADPAVPSTCSGNNYGVTYNQSNGTLSGYAWSGNIGWIQFGGLSGFPGAGGNAVLSLSGSTIGQLSGWARAVAPNNTNNGSCPLSDADNDGCWDGWISLRGTGYGVTFNANTGAVDPTNHFAWGSDVLGWIDFSQTRITPPITVGIASIDSFATDVNCVLRTPPANVAHLSWTTTGMSTCDLYKDGLVLTSNVPLNSSSTTVTVGNPSSSFSLRCTSSDGTVYAAGPIVIVSLASCAPTVTEKDLKIIER